jgi:hypothetical protein
VISELEIPTGRTVAKKRRAGRCITPFCRRKASPIGPRCRTCYQRRWRAANPIAYAFDNLRTHARTRGKSFRLTIAQFTAFCLATGYHFRSGTERDCLTVDRIDPARGYEIDNIRAITHAENSARSGSPFLTVQNDGSTTFAEAIGA